MEIVKIKCTHCQGDGWHIEQVNVDKFGDAIGEQTQCPMCCGQGYFEVKEGQ